MANIIHESVGATSKNLAVTGVVVAPPVPDHLTADWEIDYGVSIVNDDELEYWDDLTAGKRLTLAGAIHPVLLDSVNALAGYPSVKLYKGASDYHALKSSVRWAGNPATGEERIITIALLYKRTTGIGSDYVLTPQPGSSYVSGTSGYYMRIRENGDVVCDIGGPTHIVSWSPAPALWENVATTTTWNTYIIRWDFVAKTIDLWVNGVQQTQKTLTRMDFSYAPNAYINGHLGYPNENVGNTGNYAAVLVWDHNATFTNDDYLMAHRYLAAKYGLS